MKRKWKLELDEGSHELEIRQSGWSGDGSVRMDGSTVREFVEGDFVDGDLRVEWGSHVFLIHVKGAPGYLKYDLAVDGNWILDR